MASELEVFQFNKIVKATVSNLLTQFMFGRNTFAMMALVRLLREYCNLRFVSRKEIHRIHYTNTPQGINSRKVYRFSCDLFRFKTQRSSPVCREDVKHRDMRCSYIYEQKILGEGGSFRCDLKSAEYGTFNA